MSISHWGIVPGYFISGADVFTGYGQAIWLPVTWEQWSAIIDTEPSK